MNLSPFFQAMAWALLHFLWQGLALWLLAALVLRAARSARPQVRYGLALGFLGLAALLPVATGGMLLGPLSPAAPRPAEAGALLGAPELLAALPAPPSLLRALPFVLGVWVCGAAFSALRMAGGWRWLQRLKARMEPLEEGWEQRLRSVARAMGLRRPFRTGLSREVATPLVIGWFRPVVLLPASLLAGMDPAAVEALLAHEVAHLLRRDALVNGLQCAVEVLLFYHPAVWWLSRQIRLERECACDDAAVAFTGDALRYAETLDRLDDLQPEFRTAQAATGANLMYRITRLLTPSARAPRLPFALPLVALLTCGALALAARGPAPAPVTQESPAPKATPKPAAKPAPKGETKPGPAAQPSPRPEGAPQRRGITFELSVMKNEPVRLDFRVERATRAEVEAALTRIEALVDTIRAQGENRPNIKARWELSAHKGSDEELLSFMLERVTPAEARRLY